AYVLSPGARPVGARRLSHRSPDRLTWSGFYSFAAPHRPLFCEPLVPPRLVVASRIRHPYPHSTYTPTRAHTSLHPHPHTAAARRGRRSLHGHRRGGDRRASRRPAPW